MAIKLNTNLERMKKVIVVLPDWGDISTISSATTFYVRDLNGTADLQVAANFLATYRDRNVTLWINDDGTDSERLEYYHEWDDSDLDMYFKNDKYTKISSCKSDFYLWNDIHTKRNK